MVKWVKGGWKFWLPAMEWINHVDEWYSTENTVSGIVTELYGDR